MPVEPDQADELQAKVKLFLARIEIEIRQEFDSAPTIRGDLLGELDSFAKFSTYCIGVLTPECSDLEEAVRKWLDKRLAVSMLFIRVDDKSSPQ